MKNQVCPPVPMCTLGALLKRSNFESQVPFSPSLEPRSSYMVWLSTCRKAKCRDSYIETCSSIWSNSRCSWLPHLLGHKDANVMQFPVSTSLFYLFIHKIFVACTYCLKFTVCIYSLFLNPFPSVISLILSLISVAHSIV